MSLALRYNIYYTSVDLSEARSFLAQIPFAPSKLFHKGDLMALISKHSASVPVPREMASPDARPPGDADRLRRATLLQSSPVFIIPRRLPGGVAAAIDALSVNALPRFRGEGDIGGLAPRLRSAVAENLRKPRWLAEWLIADIVDKAELVAELTGAPELRVRLDVIEDDRCCKFHVDHVRLRLRTTYRGPGTEWVPPRVAARLAPGAVPPLDVVRHLARGEVAVLRGSQDATPDRPGVLHRSPPIEGSGLTRLLLVIDEAGRRLH